MASNLVSRFRRAPQGWVRLNRYPWDLRGWLFEPLCLILQHHTRQDAGGPEDTYAQFHQCRWCKANWGRAKRADDHSF